MNLEKRVVILSSITMFMSMVDINIVNVSYPYIAKYFNVGVNRITAISMVFLMMLAISIPIVGRLTDILGIKKILLAGYSVFIISGIACAFSTSLSHLIAFRGLQGIGAGMLSISATASLVAYVPQNRRGASLGYMTTAGSFGLIIGGPVGGFITDWFGWQAIFWSVIPITFIALIYGYKILPKDTKVSFLQVVNKFDFTGAVLITVFTGSFVFTLMSYIKTHSLTFLNYIFIFGGLFCLILFVFNELKSEKPLLGIVVLKDFSFSLILIINMLVVILLSMDNFIIPFFLAMKLSFSPKQTGIMLLVFSLGFGGFSSIAGKFTDKKSPEIFCLSGIILLFVMNTFFLYQLDSGSVLKMVFILFGLGASFAFFLVPITKLVLNKPTVANAGRITAIFRVTRQFASLLGVVIVGIISPKSVHKSLRFDLILKYQLVIAAVAILLLSFLAFKANNKADKIQS